MEIEYGIIVTNKTRLAQLIDRFNTLAQAEFYINNLGGDFAAYLEEDRVFQESLSIIQSRLSQVLKCKLLDRKYLANYLFAPNQLVLVVGQDGLVANTAKYTHRVPIIAINPDPGRFDGVLLPYTRDNFMDAVAATRAGNAGIEKRCFAKAVLGDGQELLAFNDLFVGASSHVSARYQISYQGRKESHSSSGVIIATRAGATGWMSSIHNMAAGIVTATHPGLDLAQPVLSEGQLQFAVREPFRSLTSQTAIVTGIINPGERLVLESRMPQNGVIFSDGMETDFLSFNSGESVTISQANTYAHLVKA